MAICEVFEAAARPRTATERAGGLRSFRNRAQIRQRDKREMSTDEQTLERGLLKGNGVKTCTATCLSFLELLAIVRFVAVGARSAFTPVEKYRHRCTAHSKWRILRGLFYVLRTGEGGRVMLRSYLRVEKWHLHSRPFVIRLFRFLLIF